jgi:hypothetical protein
MPAIAFREVVGVLAANGVDIALVAPIQHHNFAIDLSGEGVPLPEFRRLAGITLRGISQPEIGRSAELAALAELRTHLNASTGATSGRFVLLGASLEPCRRHVFRQIENDAELSYPARSVKSTLLKIGMWNGAPDGMRFGSEPSFARQVSAACLANTLTMGGVGAEIWWFRPTSVEEFVFSFDTDNLRYIIYYSTAEAPAPPDPNAPRPLMPSVELMAIRMIVYLSGANRDPSDVAGNRANARAALARLRVKYDAPEPQR